MLDIPQRAPPQQSCLSEPSFCPWLEPGYGLRVGMFHRNRTATWSVEKLAMKLALFQTSPGYGPNSAGKKETSAPRGVALRRQLPEIPEASR